jgi:hypothetical protein
MNDILDSKEPPDFSLVQGGPVFQLLVRSRLATRLSIYSGGELSSSPSSPGCRS